MLGIKWLMPWENRKKQLDREMSELHEEVQRETQQQKAFAVATVQAVRRLKKEVPPDTFLHEIAKLQRFIRSELSR